MYYNTTNEVNPQLDVFCKKAVTQDDVIESLFSENPLQTYLPDEVHKILIERGSIGKKTPLTSIRRAMTTLTKKGVLVKLHWKTKTSELGRPAHYWTKAEID